MPAFVPIDWSPPVAPGEERSFTATIASSALGGDTIASVAGTLSVYYGADPNSSALVINAATFSGSTVSQRLGGAWVPGVVYRWEIVVTTTGGQTIPFWAHITTASLS